MSELDRPVEYSPASKNVRDQLWVCVPSWAQDVLVDRAETVPIGDPNLVQIRPQVSVEQIARPETEFAPLHRVDPV